MSSLTKACKGPADGTPCPAGMLISPKHWYCETCRDTRRLSWTRARDEKKNAEIRTRYIQNASGYPGVQKSHQTEGMWIGVVNHNGKVHRTRSYDVASECYKAYLDLYFEVKGEEPLDRTENVGKDTGGLRECHNTPLERGAAIVDQLINIA
jgi:hypothetical protein